MDPRCQDCEERKKLARLEGVCSMIPAELFEVDADGRYLFLHIANTKECSSDSEVIGQTFHDVLPKPVADLCLNAVTRALGTAERQTIKYMMPDGEGRPRFFEAHFGPTTQGTVIAIVSDITQYILQQQKLEKVNASLEEMNESLEQFVYIASHDLREPLIGVAGFATLLNKRYGDRLDEQGKHFLEEVVNGCKRMEAKIDDLLLLSRAGRGKPNGAFALGAAVEEARRAVAGRIRDAGAQIVVAKSLPSVRGNRSEIAQVFQNLFSNSIKYRQPDLAPVIQIKAQPQDGDEILISVTDNGLGFDMRHADRIFGVFQRLYTVDQYPGTGIGLAIVKKIIDKHGGRIWPLSEPNKGSTFFFTLPKADPQEPETPCPPSRSEK